jgi:site-specific recombinase XerD
LTSFDDSSLQRETSRCAPPEIELEKCANAVWRLREHYRRWHIEVFDKARELLITAAELPVLALLAADHDEVFHHESNEAATRSSLNKWLMQAERRAVLEPDGALHRLRHTFCSRLARQGAPAKAISDLAGHSSFSTTARYIHLFAGE